jgi:hypothetical protein
MSKMDSGLRDASDLFEHLGQPAAVRTRKSGGLFSGVLSWLSDAMPSRCSSAWTAVANSKARAATIEEMRFIR